MKIKQQSKSDIKGLVDDIKVNVIENVGTADICDRLNIACNIKSLSCKFYYPAFRGKILFWCPTVGQLICVSCNSKISNAVILILQVSHRGTLALSKKLLFLKRLLQKQNYR